MPGPGRRHPGAVVAMILTALLVAGCAPEAVLSPKTVIDRAIEARSAADIAKDNHIVLSVNGAMAGIANLSASTEIYEQRLLMTGIMSDKGDYQRLKRQVEATDGIKELYWHVVPMTEAARDEADPRLLLWGEVLNLDARVGVALIKTAGIADVNYRVAADPFATVYLLGRARSTEEHDRALAVARAVDGVGRLVDYVEIRP